MTHMLFTKLMNLARYTVYGCCMLVLTATLTPQFSQAREPLIGLSMSGDLKQGALIRAVTDIGAKVSLNNVPLPINSKGEFLFALWRDAPETVRLRITRPGSISELRRIEVLQIERRDWDIQRIKGIASNKVTPPARDYVRIKQEGDDFRVALSGDVEDSSFREIFGDGFLQPAEGVVSGVFGSQRYFNDLPRRPHYGLDIANEEGTPIVAPADGQVRFTHPDMFFNGKTLVVSHAQGVFSSFVHLSEILVEEGQQVQRGQMIARMGATGRVTGPHLHWSVKYRGIPVDPALLLEKDSPICVKRRALC